MEVLLNGELLPEEQAHISVNDRGFLYGDGLFDTLRAYNGKPFRLEAHLARLRRSAEEFDIPMPYTDDELTAGVSTLIQRNELSDARIRIALSRGPGGGPDAGVCPEPTLLITAAPCTPYPEKLYENGASLLVSRYRCNETSPTSGHKTANYLLNLTARREARMAGADDALLLNTRGEVAEADVANVFIYSAGRLVTPALECGALPGITRAVVMELATDEGCPTSEKPFGLSQLLAAEEVFLTNSIMEVMPVTRINGTPIGSGKPGEVTARIARKYRSIVAAECGATPLDQARSHSQQPIQSPTTQPRTEQ